MKWAPFINKRGFIGVLFRQPVFLLLATGSLIGLNFPLGKIAGNAGVSPILWAFLISFGAALTLFPFLILNRALKFPRAGLARYAVISGLVSFVAANMLVFATIPRVGSGYTGLMFALSPVFTLALSLLFKFKSPRLLGLLGIGVGFAGAALVALSRQVGSGAPDLLWILVALLIPFTLACGNIFRTLAWPKSEQPDVLAFWSHGFSAIILLVLVLLIEGGEVFGQLARVPVAALLQLLVAGMTFPVFFRLQHRGGPVLLSQIGYVAAAVGLLSATLFQGETYAPITWVGAGIISVGIAITIRAQRN